MKFLRFKNSKGEPVFGKYTEGSVAEITGDIFPHILHNGQKI